MKGMKLEIEKVYDGVTNLQKIDSLRHSDQLISYSFYHLRLASFHAMKQR